MDYNGLLVLDKPVGITSREAVTIAQRWFPRRTRVGHTGTLDPLATGVLVLCIGSATRLTEYVQDMSKTYHSVFYLGATSDTDDAEGTLTPVAGASDPGREVVQAGLAALVGSTLQVPPAYSAAKIAGKRAYDLARKGAEVDLAPRLITVHGIDVLRYEYPELEVEVRCGKGTYIRSLARDLGRSLGCGGHVQSLRRTRIGPFRPEQALSLEADYRGTEIPLLPAGLALAELPRLELGPRSVERLRHGQGLPVPGEPPLTGQVGIFNEAGLAVAVAEVRGDLLRPVKVFV